jgi:riboflavin synthase alpha subunit
MQNPFRRSQMSKLQADLAKLTANRTRLLAEQAAARVGLERALDADSAFLLTGDVDDATNNKRKAAVKDMEADLGRFARPLAILASQIVEAENSSLSKRSLSLKERVARN